LLISNLKASNVAADINVNLPRALYGALNAIIPSGLLFQDVEAIVAEIISMGAALTQVSSKSSRLSASFRVSLILLLI